MACKLDECSNNSFSIDVHELRRSNSTVSEISFDASLASMFGSSCRSLNHSRWESSSGEGELSNVNLNVNNMSNIQSTGDETMGGENNSKSLPPIPTAPSAGMLRMPRSQSIKTALTKASSIASLFSGGGDSLSTDSGSDPSKRTTVSFPPRPTMMRFKQTLSRRRMLTQQAASSSSEKSLLSGNKSNHTFAESLQGLGGGSNHTFAESMDSSYRSFLSTWDSIGEDESLAEDEDDSISSDCSSGTTVLTLLSSEKEEEGEVKKEHRYSLFSSTSNPHSSSPNEAPLTMCTTTCTGAVEVKQVHDNGVDEKQPQ
jgi:hypothetical protein